MDQKFHGGCQEDTNEESIRPRQNRFSIGSAPLTSITESDAQIGGGETRCGLKIPRRFPLVAPSCSPHSCLSVYRCHSAVMAAVSHSTPDTPVPGRQFAPRMDCMHEPPFSPTAAPYPVTINLSPTRKDTTNRHWQRPLANRILREMSQEFLKWRP